MAEISAHDEGTPWSVIFGLILVAISFVLALAVVFISLVPSIRAWFGHDVTLTVDSHTQSLLWRATGTTDSPMILALPPGDVMQQQVDDNFNVKMVPTPLAIPAIEAKGPVEIRLISRGPCELELNARSLSDAPLAVYERGVAQPKAGGKEVAYVLDTAAYAAGEPASAGKPGKPAMAPEPDSGCAHVAPAYDFFLDKASTLEIGEGLGASEIPTTLVASPAVALSGTIAAHNRAWLFDTRYDLGATAINRGDFVRLAPEDWRGAKAKLSASGAASFTPSNGGLDVVVYASAAQAEVEHFGGKYVFKSTAWQTIASQPSVQFFFSSLAAMLGIMGFVMGIKKWRRAGITPIEGA